MKIGLQTISWGQNPESLDEIACCAADLGFGGLEFAQSLDALGALDTIQDTLKTRHLAVAGLAGGALTSRILAAEVLRPDYLYLDEWDEPAVLEAFNHALKIGLHPHYCKELETVSDAMPYLERYPELGLILDTAHQYL